MSATEKTPNEYAVATVWLKIEDGKHYRALKTDIFEETNAYAALGRAIDKHGVQEKMTERGFTLELYKSEKVEVE